MLNKSLDSNSTPKYFFNRLTDITPGDIKAMGAKAVALDLDNTAVYDMTMTPFRGAKEWVNTMLAAGVPVIILSNAFRWRVKRIAELFFNVPYIAKAGKPRPENYRKAAKLAQTDIASLAVIGDQLFTDIQGANGAGAISVRVKYTHREFFFAIRYRLVRRAEKKYLIHAGYGDKV